MQYKNKPKGRSKLIWRNFQVHKWKKILLSIIMIFITVLYVIVILYSYNKYKNLERYTQHVNGTEAQIIFTNLSEEQITKTKEFSSCEWIGESWLISSAEDEELGNQYTEIRYADDNYAKAYYALPTVGKMPEKKSEVAIGIRTLKKLGIPADIGSQVTISCNVLGSVKSFTFELVGYWEEDEEVESNYIWISPEFAEKYTKEKEIAVGFKRDSDIVEKAKSLAQYLGVDEDGYSLSYVNKSSIMQEVYLDLNTWIAILVVLLIGILILGSIQQISVSGNIVFYGRLKAMGAEGKQIRSVIWREVIIISLISVPIGLMFGTIVGLRLIPSLIRGSLVYVQTYFSIKVLVLPIVLSVMTIGFANIHPVIQAGKTDIDKAFKYKGYGDAENQKVKKYPGFSILFQMSLDNITRYKKRNFVGICLLTIGIIWISSFYVLNISFDEEKYLKTTSVSDFSVNSCDLSKNAVGSQYLEQYVENLSDDNGIVNTGRLYLQSTEEILPKNILNRIINYYETSEEERLNYMQYDTVWVENYKRMKSDEKCQYQIWGVDGLLVDEIMQPQNLIDGTFDKEKFLSGNYVIAQGISGDQGKNEKEPTYIPGEKIIIAGHKYEIMAVADIPYSIKQEVLPSSLGFELSFFLPNTEFRNIYPDIYIQKFFFNISEYAKDEITDSLEKLEDDQGFTFTSKEKVIEQYHEEVFSQNGVEMLIGFALLCIGVIQIVNSIFSSVIARKKEFVLLSHLGMTQRQIYSMLIFESLNCILVVLFGSYLLSLVVINILLKPYINKQWATTFNFSILPLLVLTPILLLFAVGIPIIAYYWQKKREREC